MFCIYQHRIGKIDKTFAYTFALGIAAEMFCEATNKALQRIARPVGERPKTYKNSVF
jgi:hypothetical protein